MLADFKGTDPGLLIEFLEIERLARHYHCEVEGMVADNLDADTRGQDIPYTGEAFTELSRKYHNKLEAVRKRLHNNYMFKKEEPNGT